MTETERLANELTELQKSGESVKGQTTYQMVRVYNQSFDRVSKELGTTKPREINRRIASVDGYQGPKREFLNNSRTFGEVFPKLLENVSCTANFTSYFEVAKSHLPLAEKLALGEKVAAGMTQAEVLDYIRNHRHGTKDCDFKIQVSNCWSFGKNPLPDEFDGGIHPELVANLIHHFSDTGDHVLDPMSGGGTTGKVLDHYQWFSREFDGWEGISGPRTCLMLDINPTSDVILRADVTSESFPSKVDYKPDLVIFDPPYWSIAKGKYSAFGEKLEEWTDNITKAFRNLKACLADDGQICGIVDDFNRSGKSVPLSRIMAQCAESVGLKLKTIVYNNYANFVVTMNAMEMARAKKTRTLVNGMKVIQVFTK